MIIFIFRSFKITISIFFMTNVYSFDCRDRLGLYIYVHTCILLRRLLHTYTLLSQLWTIESTTIFRPT